MRKLFVFDWDGTLANSVNKIIACKQLLAQKYGFQQLAEKTIKSVLGMEFYAALTICFPNANPEALYAYGEEFKALMKTQPYQVSLFPGAKNFLSYLKSEGVKLAVATSKSRLELDNAIQFTDLQNMFDVTCCGEEYLPKPDPAMLLHILKSLHVTANESIYIGDAVIDAIFAKNANVDVGCVLFGAGIKDDLERHSPKFMIKSWNDLLRQGLVNGI